MPTTTANPESDTKLVETSISILMGMLVVDAAGKTLGRVRELAVELAQDEARVAGLILRSRSGSGKVRASILAPREVRLPVAGEDALYALAEPQLFIDTEAHLLLDRDLLDQQIIDVDGRKVVRVNDVNLVWEQKAADKVVALRVTQVEVGTRGAARRLLKGLPSGLVAAASNKFKARIIPWDFVDLIERDPARRVRLKIGQERLSRLHPSDIADILEDLAPAEREALFSTLSEETAAEALEEMEPDVQKSLLQGLDHERAADILEEMDPGAAADVLSELSDAESDAILEEMEPEERHDVEELLEFPADSAAGLMTTDYLSVGVDATVADGVQALRTFEGDPDNVTELYLLGPGDRLEGVVTMPKLLLATNDTQLKSLIDRHKVSCNLHATDKQVAALFDKYNLRSLPVLDEHGCIAGTIHAEQVIAQLLEK